MKKIISGLLVSACLCIGLLQTGCTTTSPRTTEAAVFDTLQTAWYGAFNTYKAFCAQVVLGKVSKQNEARADAAWNDFRQKFEIAFRLSGENWSAPAGESLQLLKNEFTKFILSL